MITPGEILSSLESNEFDYESLPIVNHGLHFDDSFGINIYTGLKSRFNDITQFWCAKLHWVQSEDECYFVPFEITDIIKQDPTKLGLCRPVSIKITKWCDDKIKLKLTEINLEIPIGCWIMCDNNLDQEYLLEYPQYFVFFRQWSGE